VVAIAGPEILPADSEACQGKHCALHCPRVVVEERVVRADEPMTLARTIHPAHAVVASPPPVPLDGSYWRRMRDGGEDSFGPAAS
jgi:hypothetical protein